MASRPGRPPLDRTAPSVPVCVRLGARQYDRLYARARQARLSIPEVVRRDLRRSAKRNPK
jgi:hypothetical protein